MSLLDDARRLDRLRSIDCVFCRVNFLETHEEWCPVPRIPRIVEALEATQAMLRQFNRIQGHYPTTIPMGPHKRTEDPPTIDLCMGSCSTWPCDVAQVEPFAKKLGALLQEEAVKA